MLYFDCCILTVFAIFAHQSESRVVILGDYEDPTFLQLATKLNKAHNNYNQHIPIGLNTNKLPKRKPTEKAILQFGRHIYHLDNQNEMTSTQDKNPVRYNYVDLFNLINASDLKKGAKVKDLVVFSETPIHICNGNRQCDEDLRKFSRFGRNRDPFKKRLTRFRIVDNREEPTELYSSEELFEKEKRKKKRVQKKKHSSESMESKESSSEEYGKKWRKHKKTRFPSTKSSEIYKKRPKKHYDSNSASASVEKWDDEDSWDEHDKDSGSHEDHHQISQKRKKLRDTKHNTLKNHDQDRFFVQGSKVLFVRKGKDKKKKDTGVKRRRLGPFLPKRYHWDPDEIHNLGYYWFNGPKGLYPAPQLLPAVHSKK